LAQLIERLFIAETSRCKRFDNKQKQDFLFATNINPLRCCQFTSIANAKAYLI